MVAEHVCNAAVNCLAVQGNPAAESVLRFIDSGDGRVTAARVRG